MICIKGIFTLK